MGTADGIWIFSAVGDLTRGEVWRGVLPQVGKVGAAGTMTDILGAPKVEHSTVRTPMIRPGTVGADGSGVVDVDEVARGD